MCSGLASKYLNSVIVKHNRMKCCLLNALRRARNEPFSYKLTTLDSSFTCQCGGCTPKLI